MLAKIIFIDSSKARDLLDMLHRMRLKKQKEVLEQVEKRSSVSLSLS